MEKRGILAEHKNPDQNLCSAINKFSEHAAKNPSDLLTAAPWQGNKFIYTT